METIESTRSGEATSADAEVDSGVEDIGNEIETTTEDSFDVVIPDDDDLSDEATVDDDSQPESATEDASDTVAGSGSEDGAVAEDATAGPSVQALELAERFGVNPAAAATMSEKEIMTVVSTLAASSAASGGGQAEDNGQQAPAQAEVEPAFAWVPLQDTDFGDDFADSPMPGEFKAIKDNVNTQMSGVMTTMNQFLQEVSGAINGIGQHLQAQTFDRFVDGVDESYGLGKGPGSERNQASAEGKAYNQLKAFYERLGKTYNGEASAKTIFDQAFAAQFGKKHEEAARKKVVNKVKARSKQISNPPASRKRISGEGLSEAQRDENAFKSADELIAAVQNSGMSDGGLDLL